MARPPEIPITQLTKTVVVQYVINWRLIFSNPVGDLCVIEECELRNAPIFKRPDRNTIRDRLSLIRQRRNVGKFFWIRDDVDLSNPTILDV
jgi:hypothetical protein